MSAEDYVKKEDKDVTPAGNNLFNINDSRLLRNKERENFHSMVHKGLYATGS